MPVAKKTAEKPNTEESEQSVGTLEDKPKPKASKKIDVDSVVVNADDPIAKINQDKVMVFMKNGYSYSSPDVLFTRDKPFLLMNAIEASRLVSQMGERFDYATKEQVEEFYSLG